MVCTNFVYSLPITHFHKAALLFAVISGITCIVLITFEDIHDNVVNTVIKNTKYRNISVCQKSCSQFFLFALFLS